MGMRTAPSAVLFAVGLAIGCALSSGCVTQTISSTPGPLWQPGTYPNWQNGQDFSRLPPAPKPVAKPDKPDNPDKPDAVAAPRPPAVSGAAESAPPPAEEPEGQLRLLSPAEPEAPLPPSEPITRSADREAALRSQVVVPTPPRVRQFHAYAAIYAAGRCRFKSCPTQGWDTPHADGESESRCRDGDCLQKGWTTLHPDGTAAEVRCQPGGCLTSGWSTTYAAPGSAATLTRCQSGGCLTAGWSTAYPSGPPAQTRCRSGDCRTAGWSTQLPSGDTVLCSCIHNDCTGYGAECR